MADASTAGNEAVGRLSLQVKKLTEANGKYKNLLKLAKERIQQQEEELETLKAKNASLEQRKAEEQENSREITIEATPSEKGDEVYNILQVCQRVKAASAGLEEIWALVEMEIMPLNDADISSTRRFKEWKRFDTESELQDFIRRDTGEPLILPPYSFAPEQSAQILRETNAQVAEITEEFRRFRVRAELARKQSEAQIRDMQSNNFQSAARRIEGNDLQHEIEHARTVGRQIESMKAELAAQETHWKEAYDLLLAENNALKSFGSEALLASQWRQRYETCLQAKTELEERLNNASGRLDQNGTDSYERKYKDLKESFRLYRKKAKEIFEAQERGAVVPSSMSSATATFHITEESSADAKLSYLKNLMVNYLSSDQAVRDHIESAIATVLQFSPNDVKRIEKRKADSESWF